MAAMQMEAACDGSSSPPKALPPAHEAHAETSPLIKPTSLLATMAAAAGGAAAAVLSPLKRAAEGITGSSKKLKTSTTQLASPGARAPAEVNAVAGTVATVEVEAHSARKDNTAVNASPKQRMKHTAASPTPLVAEAAVAPRTRAALTSAPAPPAVSAAALAGRPLRTSTADRDAAEMLVVLAGSTEAATPSAAAAADSNIKACLSSLQPGTRIRMCFSSPYTKQDGKPSRSSYYRLFDATVTAVQAENSTAKLADVIVAPGTRGSNDALVQQHCSLLAGKPQKMLPIEGLRENKSGSWQRS